jgi:formate dehydrogenase subunit gamma
MTARTVAAQRIQGNSIRRFDLHQRIQHVLMFSSFIVLALTGLPMKFSEWAISQWWLGVWGGINVAREVHHIAAWVMIADCVYHAGYLLVTIGVLKRPFPTKMLPSPKDLKDFVQDMKYSVGLSKERPKFDRFSYREKFDYWAVFWGILIMVGGGLILMFPVAAAKLLPGWFIPLALVAHSDEAILAVGWILIVHMFFAHLAPAVFPMNKSIFTGKVPMERYREEYPLEYERVMAAASLPIPAPPVEQVALPTIREELAAAEPLFDEPLGDWQAS